jgi:bacterioferritin-associated ferredoxin
MLQELLRLVSSGGVHSLRQLAQRLGVSQPLVESILDELVRRGYLRPMDRSSHDVCDSCPTASNCSSCHSARVWALTEAGVRIAQSQSP